MLDGIAILVIAVIPWGDRIPVALPLVVAAAILHALRPKPPPRERTRYAVAVGAACGAVALALAVLVAGPLVDASWATYAIARGNPTAGVLVGIVAACTAMGSELALRGWIVERAFELGARAPVAIAAGALAEAVVTPGPIAARAGAALLGAGFGVLYVGARRDLAAPVAARAVFAIGLVVLETLQLV